MKENKYDDIEFFNKYAQMNRSKQGLEGAGEWHAFKELLPNLKNKRVLDLGCGYGWHCKYASEKQASYVCGVDLSKRMLEVAKKQNYATNIEYMKNSIEDVSFEKQTFDLVISSLAFHYIENFDAIIHHIADWLTESGILIFSIEHPVFTAEGTQDWYYNEKHEKLHFPLDHYFYEGKREAIFLGEKVIKYHRTLTTYISTLQTYGFKICAIVEPQPPKHLLHLKEMQDEKRRPMMLIIKAMK